MNVIEADNQQRLAAADALEDQKAFEQALDPNLDYFDATRIIQAMARRIRAQDARIEKLERINERLAGVLEPLAKRSVEHTADIGMLKLAVQKEPVMIGRVN